MVKILETSNLRRTVKLSVDDIIAVIKQYQAVTQGKIHPTIVRDLLKNSDFYLPEDL